jgi:hypothetical protein
VPKDRTVDAEADVDGGGGREKYEINSRREPSSTERKEKPCGEAQGALVNRLII